MDTAEPAAPERAMSFDIGQIVGPYRIAGVLGGGGMGRVFAVEHTITRRAEAMKVLAHGSCDPADAARFECEIQLQARLQHPNIAAVHTAFRVGGHLVLVMELVEGAPLSRIMEQGRLPLPVVLDYCCQALAALSYAHSKGIVHRDVSPANLIVTPRGIVKLTDFGLAGTAAGQGAAEWGASAGSPGYMSPEQVKGVDRIDARSDIYSLGAVLYELAAGAKVAPGETPFERMRAQLHREPIAPRTLNPALPELLNRIILTALRKNREERFNSAGEFRAALEKLRAPAHRSGWRVGIGMVVLAAVVLALASRWVGHADTHPPAGATIVKNVTPGAAIVTPVLVAPPPREHSAARAVILRPKRTPPEIARPAANPAPPPVESAAVEPPRPPVPVVSPEPPPADIPIAKPKLKPKPNVFHRSLEKLLHPRRRI
ncbi:MAG: serine/threonine-protein kinase [Bryobacteraceae bacterium]